MSEVNFTEREREYLDCDAEKLSAGSAAMRIIGGVFASIGQAIFMPSSDMGKADRGLMRTFREMRYTRYRRAVERKRDGVMTERDTKLLAKLNKSEFILAQDVYDPDAYADRIYEE